MEPTREESRPRGDPQLLKQLIASSPSRETRRTLLATVAAVLFHAALLAGLTWATLALREASGAIAEQSVTLIEIIDEPPSLVERPAPPVRNEQSPPEPEPAPTEPPAEPEAQLQPTEQTRPSERIEEDASAPDEPQGFQTLAAPDSTPHEIPPASGAEVNAADFSGEGREGGRGGGSRDGGRGTDAAVDGEAKLEDAPMHTPHTAAPELLNPREVAKAVKGLYPPMLRDMKIEGTVNLWVLIDKDGQVVKWQIRNSSGRDAFDSAALNVPQIMRFKPARNDGKPVAVWVILPVMFTLQ